MPCMAHNIVKKFFFSRRNRVMYSFHKFPDFSNSRCEKGVLLCICLEMHLYVQAPFWSAVVPESTVM
jgi:hypothetical protein